MATLKVQKYVDAGRVGQTQVEHVECTYTAPDGSTVKIADDFTFKRLSSLENDQIRLQGVGPDGKFSAELAAGGNARLVAATLIDTGDDGTLSQTFDAHEVGNWDPQFVDALAKAARKANGSGPEAVKAAEKN